MLVSPENAFLDGLILPVSRYSETACNRAFGPLGRMRSVVGKNWEGGYAFKPFSVHTTQVTFSASRTQALSRDARDDNSNAQVPCSISAIYIAPPSNSSNCSMAANNDSTSKASSNRIPPRSIQEKLVNGVLQGRKQTDIRGSCSISRRNIWMAVLSAIGKLKQQVTVLPPPLAKLHKLHSETTSGQDGGRKQMTYGEFKGLDLLKHRARVKAEVTDSEKGPLKGWVRNGGDDQFCI